jgi:hypothetical protein
MPGLRLPIRSRMAAISRSMSNGSVVIAIASAAASPAS